MRVPSSGTGFAGVWPVLYAFFDAAGGLDAVAMRRQVEACIGAGAHGLVVLGLVTEVHKMDTAERLALVKMVAEAIGGRVPLAVTVAETTVGGQSAFVRAAEAAGAAWVILQPLPIKGYGEAEYARCIGRVADSTGLPVAVQNNPTNLDVSLSNATLIALNRNHANIRLLKGEGPAIDVARLLDEAGGAFDVFCGHGGRELLTNLRSGCVGVIPAPDVMDWQLRLVDAFVSGDQEEALRLHREVLPVPVFMLQSLPLMLTYGKRFLARRIGLGEVHDRPPALAPTAFGLREMEHLLAPFGQLGEAQG